MADLHIAEYRGVTTIRRTAVQAPLMPPLSEQKINFSSSVASKAFGLNTELISILATVDCHLAFGESPTADSNNLRIPANTLWFFGVSPGHKVAAVAA